MIECEAVEFEVYGLAEQWPAEALTMIDAEARQPPGASPSVTATEAA